MTNIYVGNLPYNTTQADLEKAFGAYGAVSRATIIIDRETGKARGFGFVEMENDPEADAAIEWYGEVDPALGLEVLFLALAHHHSRPGYWRNRLMDS